LASYEIVKPRFYFSEKHDLLVLYSRKWNGTERAKFIIIELPDGGLRTLNFSYDCHLETQGQGPIPGERRCLCKHCYPQPMENGHFFVARGEVFYYVEPKIQETVLGFECEDRGSECVLSRLWRLEQFPETLEYVRKRAARGYAPAITPLFRACGQIVIPYDNTEVESLGVFVSRVPDDPC
jgi:hypothetical protein